MASEGKQRIPGGIVRGTKGWVSPAGRQHAVLADGVTICGEPLDALFEFRELEWEGLDRAVRCRRCLEELSEG